MGDALRLVSHPKGLKLLPSAFEAHVPIDSALSFQPVRVVVLGRVRTAPLVDSIVVLCAEQAFS